MKELLGELFKATISALIIGPATLIGMFMAGKIYDEKVDPWLERKLKGNESK